MYFINLVNLISKTTKVVFFSGRDEICRQETINWLKKYFKFPIELYMRPLKDVRKDDIIKIELYKQNIQNKYYIDFVLDDRNRVVDMWRNQLNITCLQVDYGDF